ncbi:hypothetical protein [Streptomyces sp. AM 2-1-1]|uniref:hypothetical protein n=1 Tax=Streptomyces sp. AM 2-1-1 TaxID=3028709 RepID=UPI0023B8D2BA|nr:hypothetical protein [Streptomyces sp. AM 2-1-1]WEH38592.1 hypothetical protein PZB77_03220 [Streptomyces sp. AM 2-1-1]
MPTTRHLLNRQRRLATVAAERATPAAATGKDGRPAATDAEPTDPGTDTHPAADTADPAADDADPAADDTDPAADDTPAEAHRPRRPRPAFPRIGLPALLCVLTVLLGIFAAWAFTSAASLRDDPGRRNSALTDIARTSEVKGQITEAVGAVFSYDYASTEKSDRAAKTYLTGKAVQQHQEMLAGVRKQAPAQKLVLTTTVTESAVERLDGDRARVLVFADQSNTRTGAKEETTYAAAMLAVDAVREDGRWRIAAIDTFTQ